MKKMKKITLILLALVFSMHVFSQNNVGIGITTPNSSAILDLTATDMGLLVPRVALTQTTSALPVTTPATSLLVYNTATINDVTPGYYYWDGSQWSQLGAGTQSDDWALLGNAGTNPSTNFIGTTDNQNLIIRTNNTEQIRVEAGGDVGVGTTTPDAKFHSHQSGTASGDIAILATQGTNLTTGITAALFVSGATDYDIYQYSGGRNALWAPTAIGHNDPTQMLDVDGDTRLREHVYDSDNLAGIDGDVLSRDAGGVIWVDPSTLIGDTDDWDLLGNAGTNPATNFIGTTDNQELSIRTNNTEFWRITTRGQIEPRNTGFSIFIGEFAGENDDFSSNYNVGIGYEALISNTSGYQNVAIGQRTLYRNTTGNSNVAIGYWACQGDANGINNTGVGKYALYQNQGNYNTGVGYAAGAGAGSPTYTNCTFLGYDSDATGSYINAMALGNGASVTASNRVRVGNTSVIRIGGQVGWSTLSDGRVKENINEDVVGIDFIMKLRPITYNINKDKQDQIIGRIDSSEYAEKYDIKKIKFTGFIAQEVEVAALEVGYDFSGLKKPAQENDLYGLTYSEFVVPLVKATQEQQEIIEELQIENKELLEQNKELQEQNIEIIKRLENLENAK
jgi:trimeric autotransporter adhesin